MPQHLDKKDFLAGKVCLAASSVREIYKSASCCLERKDLTQPMFRKAVISGECIQHLSILLGFGHIICLWALGVQEGGTDTKQTNVHMCL